MKEFTFRLKADVSYLEEQFKGGAEALKALAVQADKADDKLQVLKQVGAYVGQMDAALAKVQKKYPNLFDEIFGDVNKQITEALSPLKKMPEEMNKILSKSKIKLDSLIADPGAATVSEIKEIGDAFKAVAKAMGNTSIDFKFLDGSSRNEAKIKKLVKAMRELEESYFNVNKVVASEIENVAAPQKKSKTPKKTKKEQSINTMSYDALLKTVKEAKELSKAVYDGDDDAFDKLDNKMAALEKVFKLSEDEVAQLDVILQDLDDDIDATMNKLQKLLGDQFPSISDSVGEPIVNEQDIKNAAAVSENVDKIGVAADDAALKLDVLEDKLNDIVRNASKHDLEFSVVLNGEDVAVRRGKDRTTTDIVETAGNMMSSLGKYFVDSHTHTTTSKTTDDVDLKAFARLKKYGVTNHNAIFGPDGVSAYDFSQVSDEDMQKAIEMVEELRKSGVVTNEELSNIFKNLNSSYDVVKHFDVDNIGEFAKYINEVTRNAQASVDPLKQFQGIVDYLTGGRVDWSKYNKLLEGFTPENAKNIFDQIVRTRTGDEVDVYDFDKKSFADVVTELTFINSAGEQLSETLDNVKQSSADAETAIKNLGEEIDEAFTQETGDLESKLERLRDIAEEYGQNITQRDRNTLDSLIDQDNEKELTGSKADRLYDLQEKIDEADEALAAFEEQYDKIILKLENGKKVEILPNDKGLRDLYKFMDEGDGETFGGIGVEDVEYIRKAVGAAEEATVAINETNHKLKEQEDLYQQVRTAIKGTLEEVVGMDFTAVALEDIEREIKDGLITTLEEAIIRFKEMNNLTDDVKISAVGDNQHVAYDWEGEGNTYVGYGETVVKEEEFDALKQAEQNAKDAAAEVENLRGEVDKLHQEMRQMEDDGSYDRGYDQGYNDGVSRSIELQDQVEKLQLELADARQRVSEGSQIGDSFGAESEAVKTNIQAEIDELERLETAIAQVEQAVKDKTAAFYKERDAVAFNVEDEIHYLETLRQKLEAITTQAQAIGSIKILEQQSYKPQPLDGESLKGEQLGMDLDNADEVITDIKEVVKETKQQIAAEKEVEQTVEETNTALDKQIAKKEKLSTLDLAAQRGTLNLFSKDLKDSEGAVAPEQKEAYEQLIATVNEYKKSKEKIDDAEIARIREIVGGYKSAADIKKREIEATEAQAAATKKAKDIQDKLNKSLNTKKADGQWNSAKASSTKYANSSIVQENFALVEQAYTALQNAKQRYADRGTELSDKEQLELDELVRNFSAAYGKLNKIVSDSEKLSGNKGKVFESPVDPSAVSDMDKLEQAMREAANAATGGKSKFEGFDKTTGELSYKLGVAGGKFEHFKVQIDSTGTKLVGLNSGLKKTNRFLRDIADSTLSKIKSAIGNITGYDLIYRLVNITKQGIQYIRDIDTALTELKKVTDGTEESYAKFLQTASKTSAVIGSTVADLTNATADFARLGYSVSESLQLAEAASIYKNVGDGINDVAQASESIISTMKAFGIEADNAMSIVDRFNEVGNNFAISSTGIGEALQRSASALYESGNTIDESIALITAANSVIQNPEQVGTALKTLSLRLRGAKVELEEAGLETDAMAESTSQLQAKLKALTHGKVDIMLDADTFKSTTQILGEMSEAWENMTDIERASALELMGGKRQANILSSLIKNYETVDEVIQTSLNSQNSAYEENLKWLDSIEGKTTQFTNAVQTMWMNAISSDIIKDFVDAGTTLINIFDKMNQSNPLGIIGSLVAVGATLIGVWKGAPKVFSAAWAAIKKNITNVAAETAATKTDTVAKRENAAQSTTLSVGLKAEAAARAAQTAATNTETAAIKANTAAQVENNKAHAGEIIDIVPDNITNSIDDLAKSSKAAKEVTEEVVEEAVEAVVETAAAGTAAAGATKAAGAGIAGVGAKIGAFFSSTFGIITIAVAALGLVALAVDHFTVSFKEAKNKLKETSEELETTRSEIESLNNELKTTQERIDELNGKDTLTIAEQEELDKLIAQNQELERQIKLEEQREKILKNQQAKDALDTFERDKSFQTTSYNTYDEYGRLTGETAEIQPEMDRYIQNRAKNIELLTQAEKDLEKAQSDLLVAQQNGAETFHWWSNTSDEQNAVDELRKKVEQYENAVVTAETNMADLIQSRQETYGDVGYFEGPNLTNFQKEWNEALEIIEEDAHKYAIAFDTTGQATQDALDWVAERAGVTSEQVTKAFENNDFSGLEEFIQKLIDLGVITDATPESLQKIVDMINDTEDAAKSAVNAIEDYTNSLPTTIGELAKFEEGLSDLSDVYNEFLDQGSASAESLQGLQEVFGVGDMADEYESFVRILGDSSSTITDVQNAIESIAGSYMNTLDLAAGVAEEDINVIVSGLERLGVKNAKQLVQTRIDAYEAIKEIYKFDLSNYSNAEDAKNAYLSDILGERFGINGGLINDLAEQYGIDLANFTGTEAEKVEKAKEAAKLIAKAHAAAERSKVIDQYADVVSANPDDIRLESRVIKKANNAYESALSDKEREILAAIDALEFSGYSDATKRIEDYYKTPDFDFSKFEDIGGGSGSEKDSLAELDWIDHYFTAIDNRIAANEAKLEDTLANVANITKRNDIINAIIADYKKKIPQIEDVIDEYSLRAQQLYNSFSPDIQKKINNGSLKISEYDDELADQIQTYFGYIGQKSDWEIELANLNITIDDYELQKFNNVVEAYENELNLEADFSNRVQAKIDLLEEQGERVSEELYKAMIRGTNTQLNTLREERTKLQNQLNAAMANGVEKGSTQWYEMVTAINDVDAAIIEAETSIESFNNAIQDLHWEAFDKLIDRISSVADEAENLRDLLDTEEVLKNNFAEGYLDGLTELDKKLKDGKISVEEYTKEYDKLADTFKDSYGWAADATTALGLLTQEMENAKYRSNLYAKEIKDLTANYKSLGYSEDEYQEKLQELKDGQWDAIDAYESAKDAVLELNEARVEEIKDGIQKQIDAYEELIEKQKESLQQQREQHELAKEDKEYEDQVKEINRKIRAMENDTSASSIAQQKLLRAELAKLEEERRETEYERDMDAKEQALDDSLDLYTEGKEALMDAWDDYLTHEEQVMADSYANVTNNVEAIQVKIKELSDHYGIQISDAVTQPWEDAQFTLDNYTAKFESATSTYITKLGTIKSSLESLETQANKTASAFLAMLEAQAMEVPKVNLGGGATTSGGAQNQTTNNKNNNSSGGGSTNTVDKTPSKGSTVTVSTSATNFSSKSGNASMASFVKGGSYTVMQTSGNQVLIGKGGVATGWVDKKDLNGYAKGTLGTKKNELAWVDENGLEEIVMHAQNGRLAYLTKGSSVIPHDISENLMELGKVDPKTWLDNNRPTSVPASFVTQNNKIDMQFGSMINIEHADRDSIPEIKDAVQKQLDSYMKNINNGIKRYSR